MDLYARGIVLRNCGRFLHVASDFGSDYKTYPFLSSEMLYAGLSRERTRVPRTFTSTTTGYDFFRDFRVDDWPIWFTTGMLVDEETGTAVRKPRRDVDTHLFNSLKEGEPGIQEADQYPKFGSMETILPNRRFRTVAFSPDPNLLAAFELSQVFWMGKKRTMFQIHSLTGVVVGERRDSSCRTPFLQIQPRHTTRFQRMQIATGAQRYVVMAGETRVEDGWHFPLAAAPLFAAVEVPNFAIAEFLTAIQ